MQLTVNETCVQVEEGLDLPRLRARFRPGADLAIVDGHPVGDDFPLRDGARVVFIRRGEVPTREELEGLMAARHTPGVHGRVKAARIGVAGLGGLGSAVAVALCRTGVGHLVLADFDVVEPSNLNRQCYFVDQIGRPKTEALAETLARVNPYVLLTLERVELTAANAAGVFRGCDAVVEALDRAEAKAMLLDALLRGLPGVPVVAASGLAGSGPGNTIRTRGVMDGLWVVGDLESEARPGRGLMAPRVGIAAHHQANAVLRILLDEDPGEDA